MPNGFAVGITTVLMHVLSISSIATVYCVKIIRPGAT